MRTLTAITSIGHQESLVSTDPSGPPAPEPPPRIVDPASVWAERFYKSFMSELGERSRLRAPAGRGAELAGVDAAAAAHIADLFGKVLAEWRTGAAYQELQRLRLLGAEIGEQVAKVREKLAGEEAKLAEVRATKPPADWLPPERVAAAAQGEFNIVRQWQKTNDVVLTQAEEAARAELTAALDAAARAESSAAWDRAEGVRAKMAGALADFLPELLAALEQRRLARPDDVLRRFARDLRDLP